MKLHSTSWFLMLVLLMPLSASAQWDGSWELTISPANPTTADSIQINTVVSEAGRNLCDLMLPFETTVTRNGSAILVEYEIKARTEADPPPEYLCLATFHPVPFNVELGHLPAGEYEISIVGSTAGQANLTQSTVFTVANANGTPNGGPQGILQIPTNATWALASLLALMLGFAAVRLRSR